MNIIESGAVYAAGSLPLPRLEPQTTSHIQSYWLYEDTHVPAGIPQMMSQGETSDVLLDYYNTPFLKMPVAG